MRAAAGINDSRLALAYVTECVPEQLYSALGSFKKARPDVDIDVYNAGCEECYAELEKGRMDLVLTDRGAPGFAFESVCLGKRPCFAAFAGIYGLDGKQKAELADLENLPCIIAAPDRERDARRNFYREFLGVKNYFLFASGTEEAELMAAAGSGFYITDSDKARPGLKKLPLYDGARRLSREYYLYMNSGADAKVREFTELLKTLCVAPEALKVVG